MRCFGVDYLLFPNGRERNRMLGPRSPVCRRRVADLEMLFKTLTGRLHINPSQFFVSEVKW